MVLTDHYLDNLPCFRFRNDWMIDFWGAAIYSKAHATDVNVLKDCGGGGSWAIGFVQTERFFCLSCRLRRSSGVLL